MHFLVIALGSHGDVHPMIGIARGLRDRGHRVTFVASGYFEELPRREGLEFVPIGTADEFRVQLKNPDLWHPIRAFKAVFIDNVMPAARPTYDVIMERLVPGETVVVAHSLALGARLAQEKHGIPTVTIHLAPAVFRTVHDMPVLGGTPFRPWMPRPLKRLLWKIADIVMIDRVLAPPLNAIRAELGLPPVKCVIDHWWHSPLLTLGLFPTWFGPPQPDWPASVRLTTFPLYDERSVAPMSESLQRFLDDDVPPIAFTPGSAMTFGHDFFSASAEACRRMGRRGLLLSRHARHIPENLPAGVIHVDYAPFSQLLPRCAALVHHGGIGTTAQALAAGVPQLVMPLAHDQFDNAARVQRLGVGDLIPRTNYRAGRVAAALERLLASQDVKRACAAIADRLKRVDPLAETCTLIEQVSPAPAAALVAADQQMPATPV